MLADWVFEIKFFQDTSILREKERLTYSKIIETFLTSDLKSQM